MVEQRFTSSAVLTELVCGKMCVVTYLSVRLSCSLNGCMRFAYPSVRGDLPERVNSVIRHVVRVSEKRPDAPPHTRYPLGSRVHSSPINPYEPGLPGPRRYVDSSCASFRTKTSAPHHCGGWGRLERSLAGHSGPDERQILCRCRSRRMIRGWRAGSCSFLMSRTGHFSR